MDLLLSHALRAIQVALAAACLYVGYVGISPIASAVSIARTQLPPSDPAPQRDLSFDRYQVIATRNLFKSKAPPESAVPEEEEIQETELHLKLLGTAATEPMEYSIAVIEDLDKRERVAVAMNDTVGGGAIVKRIERRRAIIDNHGALEAISMDDEPELAKQMTEARSRQAQRTEQSARTRPPPTRRQRAAVDQLRQLREEAQPAEAQPPEAPAAQEEPSLRSVLQGARMAPHFLSSGEFGGIELQSIKPGGAFDGMEDGTICDEINGEHIKSMQALPQAVATMEKGAACIKCKMPSGAQTTRCF